MIDRKIAQAQVEAVGVGARFELTGTALTEGGISCSSASRFPILDEWPHLSGGHPGYVAAVLQAGAHRVREQIEDDRKGSSSSISAPWKRARSC